MDAILSGMAPGLCGVALLGVALVAFKWVSPTVGGAFFDRHPRLSCAQRFVPPTFIAVVGLGLVVVALTSVLSSNTHTTSTDHPVLRHGTNGYLLVTPEIVGWIQLTNDSSTEQVHEIAVEVFRTAGTSTWKRNSFTSIGTFDGPRLNLRQVTPSGSKGAELAVLNKSGLKYFPVLPYPSDYPGLSFRNATVEEFQSEVTKAGAPTRGI